jgi:hypothetical protein
MTPTLFINSFTFRFGPALPDPGAEGLAGIFKEIRIEALSLGKF